MTKDFIIAHRNDDIRQLALQAKRYPNIDMQFAIQQIDGWQRARHKLPLWAKHDDIIYPPHISMEQCSSEQTALYKQQLAKRLINNKPASDSHTPATVSKASASDSHTPAPHSILYDLTGGFGVDFSYMSQVFDHATYIEQQHHLCNIARHNFTVLNLNNTSILNTNAIDHLSCDQSHDLTTLTTIYLDPARRDTNGKKTYAISDCTPDVVTLLPTLKQKADIIIIKLSPMLDHHEAMRLLPGITEIHIVSVNNECKEILLVINQKHPISPTNPPLLYCVNNNDTFITPVQSGSAAPSSTISKAPVQSGSAAPSPIISKAPVQSGSAAPSPIISPNLIGKTLYIPNASIMKAGCFSTLCQRFSLQALDTNSHLFISAKSEDIPVNNNIESFPGRSFTITTISTMNKKDLKSSLSGITKANIAVRNFPLSADALRKKLSLKDGGDIYIFATTIAKNHLLLICNKTS